MLPDLPWNAALTGSPTQHPPLTEITAKRIIRLHQNLASYLARCDPEEERESIINGFQEPMEVCLEPSEPRKLPRKMRPRRRKREHHQRLPGANESVPGTSQPPRGRMSTSVKHPQLPQLPQHHQPPRSTANENSSRANLPDQPDPGRLYSRPIPASARNPQPDLVETTSLGLLSPSTQSNLIETTSLGRPVGL